MWLYAAVFEAQVFGKKSELSTVEGGGVHYPFGQDKVFRIGRKSSPGVGQPSRLMLSV